jgi:hypothetical protein
MRLGYYLSSLLVVVKFPSPAAIVDLKEQKTRSVANLQFPAVVKDNCRGELGEAEYLVRGKYEKTEGPAYQVNFR